MDKGRLVLTRRNGESIVIGTGDDQVVLTVLDAPSSVRLAFVGPTHIPINRSEIAKKKGLL